MNKLSILIPVFNEEASITLLLHTLQELALPSSLEKEVIIVDDASTDATSQAIDQFMKNNQDLSIVAHRFSKNSGKGAAIKRGIEMCTGELILIQDADLEYDPNEYGLLLKPVMDGKADVVYGSRFMGGNPHRILFFWHSIGNKFLTTFSNALTNLNLTDMESGFKLFRASALRELDLKENRFGFEPEVTAKISRIPGIRIYEVGISYYGRTYSEGKKINWKDGVWALWCIFRYNLIQRK